MSTERLKNLFTGIAGVKLVDNGCGVLRGESVRDLREACGAGRYLRPMKDDSLSWEERRDLRKQGGQVEGFDHSVDDRTLLGLNELLVAFPELSVEDRQTKAKLLWEELAHLEDRRGKKVFTGNYTWTYYRNRYSTPFDSAFVRRLNKGEWIPDEKGRLQRPELIPFDSLGWPSNPFLLSKIHFKPPVINQLAEEAGLEPDVLDLLRKLGITSAAELIARLGLPQSGSPEDSSRGPATAEEALGALLGNVPNPTPPVGDTGDVHSVSTGGAGSGTSSATNGGYISKGTGRYRSGEGWDRARRRKKVRGKSRTINGGAPPFISYVAAHPDDEESDPDGLEQSARMASETKAINLILSREPNWKRTPGSNPGFDLFEPGPDGKPVRWREVKAMTGSLRDHPVGVFRKQFDFARQQRADYWLYVVEHTGDGNARIVRIQDPAGKARTFTFDRGWLSVAQRHSERDHPTD